MRDSALRCQSFIKDNSFRWLIVITASAFICACSGGGGSNTGNTDPGQPPPTTSFSGTVTMNGSPVAAATVIAFNTNTNSTFATTTTDANGQYSFSGMGTSCTSCISNFQFWVVKTGYAFYPQWTGNMTGNRFTYLWDSAPSNWYIATGTAITRAGYNGQFTNASGGAGLIFTVFNLDSTPGNSVTGANFMAFDGSNPRVQLAASGQTISYVTGDDAFIHAGVAWPTVRFVDNNDGTITDELTGLIWLKDAGCLAPTLWNNAINEVNQLASGSCGLTDGSAAGQWRMPNRKELESLADRAQNNQADFFDTAWSTNSSTINSMNAVFTNFIQLQYYWTSSTDASNISAAWTVFSCDYGVYDIPKTNSGYTLAVR